MFKQNKVLTQLAKYLFTGGIYFWVGYLSFALLWSAWGWSLFWAAIVSNFIGWIANFLMQRYWVFNNPALSKHRTQVTSRYFILTLFNFGLNYLILLALRKSYNITPYIGQFVSAAFFTVWNYFWYRYWVFPSKVPAGRPHINPLRIPFHIPHGHNSF